LKIRRVTSRTRQPGRKTLLFLIVLLLGGIGVGSYFYLRFTPGDLEAPTHTAEPAVTRDLGETKKDPRIVLLTQLTGSFRKEGEMLRMGIELAWQELQQKGLRSELSVCDAGKNSAEAARWASELADDPDVITLIAHLPITLLMEIAPILEDEGVVAIIPAGSHQQLEQHPSLLPLVCLDDSEGVQAATIAKEWAQKNPVAVAYAPSKYGELLHQGFVQQAQAIGLDASSFAVENDAIALQETVSQLLQVDPAVIWLAGSPFWGEKIITLLAEKEYRGRILVPRSYGEALIEDLFGDHLDRLYVFRPVLMTDSRNGSLQEFARRFREEYWREPHYLAALGYDAMQWLGQLLQKGSTTRSSLRSQFLGYDSAARAYQGLAGPVYFDSRGRPHSNLQVAVFKDGRFVPADEKDQKEDPAS
jgi:branched-chain amino acid transport system substrate-binding protein